MTDMFLEKFRALVPKYLEDEWQEEDGLPPDELDAALAEHQFQVPLVLREFYHGAWRLRGPHGGLPLLLGPRGTGSR